jgi:hypothetical protein
MSASHAYLRVWFRLVVVSLIDFVDFVSLVVSCNDTQASTGFRSSKNDAGAWMAWFQVRSVVTYVR